MGRCLKKATIHGQLSLSPRARIIPDDQTPGEPAELNLGAAERLREEREKKAADWERRGGHRAGSSKRFNDQRSKRSNSRGNNRARKGDRESSPTLSSDPWAKARSKSE